MDYSFYINTAYSFTALVMLYLFVATLRQFLKSKKALKKDSSDGV